MNEPAVLKEDLEDRGLLREIRCMIREKLFDMSLEKVCASVITPCHYIKNAGPPPVTAENLVINELIREYLAFNNYRHTLSIFSHGMVFASSPTQLQ